MRLVAPAAAALALLLATPAAGDAQAGAAAPVLRLGPGDAVRLQVFTERGVIPPPGAAAGAVQDYDVDAGGRVLLPVAGLVVVAGRDFEEVRREVEAAFAAEFTEASVRLVPLLRVAVLGEVRAPGLIAVDPTMALPDVLAAAGGLTDLADQNDIRLVRAGAGVVVASARSVVEERTPLVTGDRIVVGRRSWASQNLPWLLGASASVVASLLTALLVR